MNKNGHDGWLKGRTIETFYAPSSTYRYRMSLKFMNLSCSFNFFFISLHMKKKYHDKDGVVQALKKK